MEFSFVRARLTPLLFAIALLAALFVSFPNPALAQQPKKHQATGIVVATSAAHIILLRQFGKNKVRWTFVLAPHSTTPADLPKGARARIYYHDEKGQHLADRWKVIEPPPPASSTPKPSPPKPVPATPPAPPAPATPAPTPKPPS